MRRIDDDVEIDRVRFGIWSRTSSTSAGARHPYLFCWSRANKRASILCLCRTDSLRPGQATGESGVGEGWVGMGGGGFSLILQCNCIFVRLVYLPWTPRPSALQGLLFVFTMSQSPDPKYTLRSDSPTQNTHTHTHSLGHTLLIETRVLPPPLPARPLPAARTHIVSHCLPLSHPLWMAPRVLSFLSDFLALSLPPAACLNPSYLSMNLPISCVSMYWSPYLCPSSSLPFISSVFPQGKEEKGKRQS